MNKQTFEKWQERQGGMVSERVYEELDRLDDKRLRRPVDERHQVNASWGDGALRDMILRRSAA